MEVKYVYDELGSSWQENVVAHFNELSCEFSRGDKGGVKERPHPVGVADVPAGIRFLHLLNINTGCNLLIQQNENSVGLALNTT
jgi:hypothetical protein